jgi:hypothetical protein
MLQDTYRNNIDLKESITIAKVSSSMWCPPTNESEEDIIALQMLTAIANTK